MAITLDGSNGITTDIASNESATLNRDTTDGNLIVLQKDNTNVGAIGVNSSYMYIGDVNGTLGAGLHFVNGAVRPFDAKDNLASDAGIELGRPTNRFLNLYLSGGVYLGGTGAANYLDDYEEGTWTPSIGGTATYLIQSGYYTKIGRMVHYSFELHVNAIGSGSNNRIGGLPFAGNSNRESQGSRGYFASLAKSVTSLLPYVPKGDTGVYFTDTTTAQSTVNLNSVIMQNNARIQASGIYFTA